MYDGSTTSDAGLILDLAYLTHGGGLGFVVNVFLFLTLGTLKQLKVFKKAGTAVNIPTVTVFPIITFRVTDRTIHKNLFMASICSLTALGDLGSFEVCGVFVLRLVTVTGTGNAESRRCIYGEWGKDCRVKIPCVS